MAVKTPATLHTTNSGHPERVIPIRNTATSGRAEDVNVKEGQRHLCLYFSDIDNADTYAFGRPIRNAVFQTTSAGTADCAWDPDDATGTVTFASSAANATGYLHIWARN